MASCFFVSVITAFAWRVSKRWPFRLQKGTFYKPICGLLQAKRPHIGNRL